VSAENPDWKLPPDATDWECDWESSRRFQLNYWAAQPLKDQLKAVEEMGKLAAKLAPPDATTPDQVAEMPPAYGTTTVPPMLPLPGCTPEPLINYLKALGILRLIAEHPEGDKNARAYWKDGVFYLEAKLQGTRLDPQNKQFVLEFLLKRYKPTPIVAPWNGGCGFYKKWDPKRNTFKFRDVVDAVEEIEQSTSPAFEGYRKQIRETKNALTAFARRVDVASELKGKSKAEADKYLNSVLLFETNGQTFQIEKADKDEFLTSLRSEILDDQSLQWLDAAIVLLTRQKKNRMEAPLLGSGGNIGNSDFSARFMQLLLAILPAKSGEAATPHSEELLNTAIFSKPVAELISFSVDQFDPGKAGSANMGQGLNAAPMLNPWDYILMVEGALMLAGATTRRLGAERDASSFPFTVDSSPVGFASAGKDETRRELWLPVWERPCSKEELRMLLAEGRAQVGRRVARDGVEFARAIASLGTDRGIKAFTRFQFQKRLGDNYLANSLGRFEVTTRREVDLLREIDPWLFMYRERIRQLEKTSKKGPPHRFYSALRRIDRAIFDYCRYGDSALFQRILIALGQAETEIASGESFRADNQSRTSKVRPCGRRDRELGWRTLSRQWIVATQDRMPEFELALSLAGIHDRAGKIGPLRANLEPIDWKKLDWAAKDRSVVWNSASLTANLSAVLARRVMDGLRAGCEHLPLAYSRGASLGAIAYFLAGDVNENRLQGLLWGLMLADQTNVDLPCPQFDDAPPLPREFALLKLLFLPFPLDTRADKVAIKPEPAILSLLAANRVGEACQIAMRRLRATGLAPLPHPVSGGVARDDTWREQVPLDGRRLAAALLFPLSRNALSELTDLVLRPEQPQPQTA
jgi:CRISPR-associated protein Csx17